MGGIQVRVYNEKHLVSIHQANDIPTGLRFGRFGREDNTMIMTHASGALSIKILPRHASLEASVTNQQTARHQLTNSQQACYFTSQGGSTFDF
jgi:hypothetical protein